MESKVKHAMKFLRFKMVSKYFKTLLTSCFLSSDFTDNRVNYSNTML